MTKPSRLIGVLAVATAVGALVVSTVASAAQNDTSRPAASRTASTQHRTQPSGSGSTTVSAGATVARCKLKAPTTAAGYQAMFNAKNDRTWSGGDQASSLRLPDGRTLWIFADTIQGTQAKSGAYAPGWRMVHNSIVIQDGGCLTGVTGRTGGEVIPNPSKTEFYWPQHAVVEGGKLLVFTTRVKPTGKGTYAFAGQGVYIAVFSLPTLGKPTFERVVTTPASRSAETLPQWGQGVVQDGAYTYLYGSAKVNLPYHFGKSVYVARAPKGKLLTSSSWQYWTGSTWSTSQAAASAVIQSVPAGWSTSFSVQKNARGVFQYVTKENDVLGSNVITGTSQSAVGPFSSKKLLSRPSYSGPTKQDLYYNPMGHAELKVAGGFLGHISRNTASTDLRVVGNNADRYKPQFFTVPVL